MRDKHSPQKILATISLAVVLLLGSAITIVAWRLQNDGQKGKPATSQTANESASAADTAKKPAATTSVKYDGQEGKTALALLEQEATVVTKDSSYGPYVDSINGVTGGTDGKYWTFYVNGAQAQVGAGAYTTKATDKIEWKFE
jgi:hypothetical protein